MKPRLTMVAASLSAFFASPQLFAQTGNVLDPVVVTATRQETRVNEVLTDVTVITSEEIRNAGPSASIAELLGRQPGIEYTQAGGPGQSATVYIRGTNANHVLLLVDGIRTGSATTGSPTWEYIPLEQIDHIEIIRGPASALYGSDAIGGVVQIFTKRGEGPLQAYAEAGYGTYNTVAGSAGFSGSKDGLRYSFQVSNKRSDGFAPVNNPISAYYNPAKAGYQNASSSGSVAYSPNSEHEFGVNYMYSDGLNHYNGYRTTDDFKQKESIYGASVFSRNRLTDRWTSTVRVGQSSDDSRNFDNGVMSSTFHTRQTQYEWQNDIKLPLGRALLRAERLEQHVSSNNAYALTERAINSFQAGWTALIDKHSIQLNARQDNNSQFGNHTTETIGYGYQLEKNWRGAISWGTAFKAPTFNDLYFPPDGWGDVSNPNLKPETSINREASLHYETETQHASATYYHNELSNLIQWAPIDPTNPYSGWTPSNVSQATLSGWTFAYNNKFGVYKLSGSLDLQDPKDDVLQKTLINRARSIAKIALSRDYGALNLGGEIKAIGKRYADTANTQVLSGYALLNLTANYRVDKDWTVFARANNVFDKKYVLVRDYATPGANFFVGARYTLN